MQNHVKAGSPSDRPNSHDPNDRSHNQSQLWLNLSMARFQAGSSDVQILSSLQSPANTSDILHHDPTTVSNNPGLIAKEKNENPASDSRYLLSTAWQSIFSLPYRTIYQVFSYTTLVLQTLLRVSLGGLEALMSGRDLYWTIPKDHVRIRWTCVSWS
jgi:hypothetical protein